MTALFDLMEHHIVAFFAVFFRVGAFVGLLPGFGEATVSVRVKLGLAAAFTMALFPMVLFQGLVIGSIQQLAVLIATETLAGILLGIGLRLLMLGLQTAGTIAAQSTSLSQAFGNAGVEPMPAIGHVLLVSGLALLMMTGLHIKAAQLFVLSYEIFPLGRGIGGGDVADWGVAQVAHVFQLAFLLSVPFVALSMLYNLALGVINKAMPQLMVAFVGAPAITLGGLFVLFASAPLMLEVWKAAIDSYFVNPLGVQ
ncbi:MAG: flagellar biosynthetic protein FliR [Marinovum sp.]|nr:flagellar biosynthetic protein FliR [Marinovum sp.]